MVKHLGSAKPDIGLAVLVIILTAISLFPFSYPPVRTVMAKTTEVPTTGEASTTMSKSTVMMTANPCGPASGMTGMNSMTSMSFTSPIIQNTTTADYKLMLKLGPPETMLMMCQVTNSTIPGEVMVSGQMMGDMSTGMNGTTYHVELHIYDIKTGATVALPVHEVTITITNSSGMSRSLPIAEMFGVQDGVTDLHYGNNIQIALGSYTIGVSVADEKASYRTSIPTTARQIRS
jgi:hypothetical protein